MVICNKMILCMNIIKFYVWFDLHAHALILPHVHTHTPIHTRAHTHTHTLKHMSTHSHTHTRTAQGVKAVIAESFERIHRSNLVGMGIVPLQYLEGQTAATLGLNGTESYSIELPEQLTPGQRLTVKVRLVCVV